MKTKQIRQIWLIILYAMSIFFLFALLRYWAIFTLGIFPNVQDSLGSVRVFLSGPFLVVIGFILVLGFRKQHKIAGWFFVFMGVLWLSQIIATIISEAA